MAEEAKPQSWWGTLPGILTATAGIITAVAGLVGAMYQAGFFLDAKKASGTEPPPIAKPRVPGEETKRNAPASSTDSPKSKPPDKAPAATKRMNLFSADNGGQLMVAPSDDWKATIDGKENSTRIFSSLGKEAIYGFKDDRAAAFDTFTTLISETQDCNVNEFELLASNDLAAGTFESLGKFQTQNVKIFKAPYQEFKFKEVTAKYLKVKLLTLHGRSDPCINEFQLLGSLR
jgi:hypothetical protein